MREHGAVGGHLLAANPLALGFNTVEINTALRWKTGRYTEGEPMPMKSALAEVPLNHHR